MTVRSNRHAEGFTWVHPVPENKLGILAMHSEDLVPMANEGLTRIIEGPLADLEPELLKFIDDSLSRGD
jgi:hypothetical protein